MHGMSNYFLTMKNPNIYWQNPNREFKGQKSTVWIKSNTMATLTAVHTYKFRLMMTLVTNRGMVGTWQGGDLKQYFSTIFEAWHTFYNKNSRDTPPNENARKLHSEAFNTVYNDNAVLQFIYTHSMWNLGLLSWTQSWYPGRHWRTTHTKLFLKCSQALFLKSFYSSHAWKSQLTQICCGKGK